MKITGTPGPNAPAAPAVSETSAAEKPAAPVASTAAAGGALASAGLQAAQAELQSMPEIDQAKVAMLREALAKGELPFDAAKLAGLIDRYHGSRS
jgi:negative regulator of flagellin synthesis FlgM